MLTELTDVLGETMGSTKDKITRDAVAAGTAVYYAGNTAGGTAITAKLTAAELLKISRALQSNNAKMWRTNPIAGTDAVGTKPIPASYFAVVHPYTTYDLRSILSTSWVGVHEYPDPSMALPGEVGAYPAANLRFIESTNAKIKEDSGGAASTASTKYTTASTAADIYCTIIFGQNAFGIAPLTGGSAELIVKEFGSGDDPLNQRRTAGFKFATDTVILDDNMMYRYEHLVSA
jgi:N4-gp56 family major capsid protein